MSARASVIPVPGPLWGVAPERAADAPRHSLLADLLPRLPSLPAYRRRIDSLAQSANAAANVWYGLPEADFTAKLRELRQRVRHQRLNRDSFIDSLGAAAAQIRRTLGLRVYTTQCFAAIVMLDGQLAEMSTGEGKTIAAALAAAVHGLAGTPVHVVTANDYLVQRDSRQLKCFYAGLGLEVAHVVPGMSTDVRRQAYAADVVYCTAKELVFDYLRDGLALKRGRADIHRRVSALLGETSPDTMPMMRGLCAAILDEADSILIDEATIPLILSAAHDTTDRRAFLWQALAIARYLRAGHDFEILAQERQIELSETGRQRVIEITQALQGAWRRTRYATEVVTTALTALHALRRDVDYVVRDDAICPLDQVTGRIAEGRVWSRGLHTLLQLKERCALTPETDTVARTSYPRFFRRYLRLAGMSGTLTESARELSRVYGLSVVPVPLLQPSRRRDFGLRIFTDPAARWAAVTERVQQMWAVGRPILIGTDTIEDSEGLAACLLQAGITCQVLHARQDADEAAVIARAGERSQVTVATRMAGRGTDIRLGAGIAALGGLHVINCQSNSSLRLDRQLAGRCARQGDAGSVELCRLCDPVRGSGISLWAKLTSRLADSASASHLRGPGWWLRPLARWPLSRENARARRLRAQLLQLEREWVDKLNFMAPGD